jgi:tetratricopeptide (TPR) repeat protein
MSRASRRALAAGLLLLPLLAGWLLAYHGRLQDGFDRWTAGDLAGALQVFERERDDPAEGALARLNAAIARGELLLDRLDATRRAAPAASEGLEGGGVFGPAPPEVRVVPLQRELLAVAAGLDGGSFPSDMQLLAWHHAGRFRLAGGESDAGLALLDRAYRRRPDRQWLANPLLRELIHRQDAGRLEATARHHVEQRPDNPVGWWALGEADRLRGLSRRALGQFKRGIEVFPLRPMLESGIVLALATGREDLALDWLERLRFRYGGPAAEAALAAWCDSVGVGELWRALPPDEEHARYGRLFPQFFPVGREWQYQVRYGILPLGKLVVGILGREDQILPDGSLEEAYRVVYRVDSNPIYRLLIDLHDVYEAVIPAHCLHSSEFVTSSLQGRERYDRIYEFDFETMTMEARGYYSDGHVFRQRLPIAQQLFDGLSLLFAGRRQVLEERYGPVLTIIDEEVHRTVIQPDGRGRVKVMGRQHAVRQVLGSADYQGIAGLTGAFWGALSDDDEALPLMARFQIKVGRITIELEEIRETGAGARP